MWRGWRCWQHAAASQPRGAASSSLIGVLWILAVHRRQHSNRWRRWRTWLTHAVCCGSSGSSCCVAWLALLAARCCFAAARRGQQQLDRCALDSRRTPPTTQQQVEAMAHVVGARGVLLPRASTPECTSAAAATPHFRRGPQLAAACELTAPRHWDCRWHPLHPLPLSLCAASSHALDSSPTCASRARAS